MRPRIQQRALIGIAVLLFSLPLNATVSDIVGEDIAPGLVKKIMKHSDVDWRDTVAVAVRVTADQLPSEFLDASIAAIIEEIQKNKSIRVIDWYPAIPDRLMGMHCQPQEPVTAAYYIDVGIDYRNTSRTYITTDVSTSPVVEDMQSKIDSDRHRIKLSPMEYATLHRDSALLLGSGTQKEPYILPSTNSHKVFAAAVGCELQPMIAATAASAETQEHTESTENTTPFSVTLTQDAKQTADAIPASMRKIFSDQRLFSDASTDDGATPLTIYYQITNSAQPQVYRVQYRLELLPAAHQPAGEPNPEATTASEESEAPMATGEFYVDATHANGGQLPDALAGRDMNVAVFSSYSDKPHQQLAKSDGYAKTLQGLMTGWSGHQQNPERPTDIFHTDTPQKKPFNQMNGTEVINLYEQYASDFNLFVFLNPKVTHNGEQTSRFGSKLNIRDAEIGLSIKVLDPVDRKEVFKKKYRLKTTPLISCKEDDCPEALWEHAREQVVAALIEDAELNELLGSFCPSHILNIEAEDAPAHAISDFTAILHNIPGLEISQTSSTATDTYQYTLTWCGNINGLKVLMTKQLRRIWPSVEIESSRDSYYSELFAEVSY